VNEQYSLDPTNNSATITIRDNDVPQTNTIVSVVATLPDASEPDTAGRFTFVRTGETNTSLTVYMAYGGTATLGSDYNLNTNSVTFFPGHREAHRFVSPLDDQLVETNETVMVQLIGHSTYHLDAQRKLATVTIHDNDQAPPSTNVVVSVEAVRPDISENPNDPTGQFTFRRTGPTNTVMTVQLFYSGTAQYGFDYNAITNWITFPAGHREVHRVIAQQFDEIVEGDETVVVELRATANYSIDPAAHVATITIHDDDHAQTNVIVTVEATLPDASEPSTAGRFTFTRTGPTNAPLTVYAAFGGTATLGVDYTVNTNAITFFAGHREAARFVSPIDDQAIEGNETVMVQLIDHQHYDVDRTNFLATVTLHDNDQPRTNVVVSVEATLPNAWEPETSGRFTFRRTGPTNTTFTVQIGYGGTATHGVDYVANTNMITFMAGHREVHRFVSPLADDLVEGTETVNAFLVGAGHYEIDPVNAFATVSIHDPGQPVDERPRLEQCVRVNGGVHLRISSEPGQVLLQSSPDLTNWSDVTTLSAPDGTVEYVDESADAVALFYRVIQQ
jgi:hypothetical protein